MATKKKYWENYRQFADAKIKALAVSDEDLVISLLPAVQYRVVQKFMMLRTVRGTLPERIKLCKHCESVMYHMRRQGLINFNRVLAKTGNLLRREWFKVEHALVER
jgi:hypothetical protein